VSTPDVIARTSRGWSRDPVDVALGTDRTGVSAALWTHDADDVQEVWSDPLDAHLVSVQFSRYHADLSLDGRRAFSKWLRPGDSSLVRAGERPHAVHTGAFSVLHLYVPPALLSDVLVQSGHPPSAIPEFVRNDLGHDPGIARIAREVLAEMRAELPLSRLLMDALGQHLAIHLLRRWSSLATSRPPARERAAAGLAPWQRRRAVEWLSEHLRENVTLADLAATSGLSAFHFARMFKRSTGLAPHAYQRHLRCARATELLVSTGFSVGEIAVEVGYRTPQAFARMFRAEVGVSPTAYRRARRL